MDCIQVQLLCSLCKINLSSRCAVLCCNANLKVVLRRRRYYLTEKLCKLCSMLCLFISSLLIVKANLRISLTECCAGHCQIHSNLRALALKVCAKVCLDVFRNILCYADDVLCCPAKSLFLNRNKLGLRSLAGRTLPILRKICKLNAFLLLIVDMTANCASVFHNFSFHDLSASCSLLICYTRFCFI